MVEEKGPISSGGKWNVLHMGPFNAAGLNKVVEEEPSERMCRGLERGMCWSAGSLFFPLSGLPFPLEAIYQEWLEELFELKGSAVNRPVCGVAWTTDELKLASSTYEKSWGDAASLPCGSMHVTSSVSWKVNLIRTINNQHQESVMKKDLGWKSLSCRQKIQLPLWDQSVRACCWPGVGVVGVGGHTFSPVFLWESG